MIAARNPTASRPVRGVNVIVLSEGREVHLDDIATAGEGQAILDEVDAAILAIEDRAAHTTHSADPDWWLRAHIALKKKRRIRPALQLLIAAMRRSEKREAAAAAAPDAKVTSHKDARRKAFVSAAEAMLDRDLFVEIWQRAAELQPAVPEGGAAS